MWWIEGLSRTTGAAGTIAVNERGERRHQPLQTIDTLYEPAAYRQKSKLDVEFREWERCSSSQYTRAMGLSCKVAETHHVFRFRREGLTYLVPAQVFLKACFRPLKLLIPYLFKPQGLEQVCFPKPHGAAVQFTMTGVSQRLGGRSTLQQPFSWLWSFPSANRMWASVYEYSRNGVLGCDLPLARARIVMRGKRKDGVFLVTEMTVLQVTASEPPFLFAAGHPTNIVFHEGVEFRKRLRSDFVARADETLLSIGGQWDITDLEWEEIYQLFHERRGSHRKHELRDILNGIVTKLGTGVPWKKFEFRTGTWSNASKLYGECRHDGRWSQIQEILMNSRGAKVSS